MPTIPSKDVPTLTDADIGFKGMNSRIDASLIETGYVSKAVNRRFEQGKIRNRWGVVRPVWGGKWHRGTRVVAIDPHDNNHSGISGNNIPVYTQIACDPDLSPAQMIFPNGTRVTSDNGNAVVTSVNSGNFSGNHDMSYHLSTDALPQICGVLTYQDATTGAESILVATNEARSDGGQGKVYVLRPGQSHLSILSQAAETINMNGHDFYQPVRMIRAANAVVMLRPGPVRYYFTGAAVELGGPETVHLSVVPEFETGTKVQVERVPGAAILGSIVDHTHYFAHVVGKDVSFYATRALAQQGVIGNAIPLAPTTAASRYYVLVSESINWWSQGDPMPGNDTNNTKVTTTEIEIANDGPPLIMQASPGFTNPLDAGFDRVPDVLTIITVQNSAQTVNPNTITVPNHLFVPGDRVLIDETTYYYVYPVDSNTLKLYNGDVGEDLSLVGGDGNLVIVTPATDPKVNVDPINLQDKPIRKAGSSGASIPAGREGLYFSNRLIIVYGFDQIAVSDVLDPLHYLPLISEFKLNTGTNDPIVALYPFNQTTLLVFKQRSILAIQNIYGDLSNVQLVEMSREFGCLAPRTIVSTGADVLFLSQRGVISIKQSQLGIEQSVILPLSDSIQDVVENISQPNATTACAAYWDNRYIISAPSEMGDGSNDLTLVYNFLNGAWDGLWQGDYLKPIEFERLTVNGTPRLVWADTSGHIHYFSPDALVDDSGEIQTEVRFRAHTCRQKSILTGYQTEHKQWVEARLSLGSWNPTMTLLAVFDGLSEELILVEDWTRSRTSYMRFGLSNYAINNAHDDFFNPYREDYLLKPGFMLKTKGVQTNAHQLFNYRAPIRQTGSWMQPVLITSQGSVEIYSVQVTGIIARGSGTVDT